MKRTIACWPVAALVLLAFGVPPAQAKEKWPFAETMDKDLTKYWEQWPDQKVAYVKKKAECEKAELDDAAYKAKTGKDRKIKACLVKADVYIERGFRYLIYRDSFIYYAGGKFHSIQLGELQKAWKEGGVPAPTTEQASTLLKALVTEKLDAAEAQVAVQEIGRPRPYGDLYRVTLVLNLQFTRKGNQEKREKVFATLESDGTDWKPTAGLTF